MDEICNALRRFKKRLSFLKSEGRPLVKDDYDCSDLIKQTFSELKQSTMYVWKNNEITFYDHPESGYLKLLVEFGLPAFSLLLFMILYTMYQNINVYAKTKLIEYLLYIAAIVSWLIGFYTVYSLGDIRIKLLVALVFVLSVSSIQSKGLSQSINNNIHV